MFQLFTSIKVLLTLLNKIAFFCSRVRFLHLPWDFLHYTYLLQDHCGRCRIWIRGLCSRSPMRYHWATTFLQIGHHITKRRNFTPVNPYKHSNFSAVKPVFFYNAEIKKDSQNKLLQNITGIWSDLNNYIYQKHCRCPNLRTLRQKRSRLHTVHTTVEDILT